MLTPRQKSILEFIVEFRRLNGCSPSIPEIQKAFAIRSPNGVAGHLLALEAKGYIRRARRGSRQIDVTGPCECLRAPSCDLPLYIRLPGTLPAAKPEGCVTIDEKTLGFRPTEGAFALKVSGRSMRGTGLLDGDIVVVEPGSSPTASPGSKFMIPGAVRILIRRLE